MLSNLLVFVFNSFIGQSLFLHFVSAFILSLIASPNLVYLLSVKIFAAIDNGLNSVMVGRVLYINNWPKIL